MNGSVASCEVTSRDEKYLTAQVGVNQSKTKKKEKNTQTEITLKGSETMRLD